MVEQPDRRETLEQRIRELCDEGDVGRAVEVALSGYGGEFMRLMTSLLRDTERAREAYAIFSETLLMDLPSFRWESSFRTWSHRVARNVAYRLAAAPSRREVPVSQGAFVQQRHHEWSRTHPWLRTDVKERIRALRSRLEPREQMLLELRIDRRMSWTDVARRLGGTNELSTPDSLARRAAVLRQQFQRIKSRLRALAREAELLSRESST
ncbi:sigma-70 family RNA polymerase sigma factor [Pyxidicoccus fallax]|uniref:Sigma-70 family RNA polymerase sigma factor n=1 Tax=Pyxidicoccus fallax TaxID=394095 RepID=A0A848LA18_9BACT|nr:sigma-70 family RNA polymerase sigma factor [Pyxidicoccus fallax]NMO15356.1 sigma-70 family RNA polymerase sigma factor [Pyxidicoccus fallax]NPC77276.1 sigma-70 family RNA polymerase sigma factor [Pyxidicoccus fallax]